MTASSRTAVVLVVLAALAVALTLPHAAAPAARETAASGAPVAAPTWAARRPPGPARSASGWSVDPPAAAPSGAAPSCSGRWPGPSVRRS